MAIRSSKAVILEKIDMRQIQGGAAKATFPCRVVEADGTVREQEVSSVEECLEFAK